MPTRVNTLSTSGTHSGNSPTSTFSGVLSYTDKSHVRNLDIKACEMASENLRVGVSPVNKGADNPNSTQQLNHQGQVDFQNKTCGMSGEKRDGEI